MTLVLADKVCVVIKESASYEEQQRSRRTEEAYRAYIIKQREINLKNAANHRAWESINNSLKSLGETIIPNALIAPLLTEAHHQTLFAIKLYINAKSFLCALDK